MRGPIHRLAIVALGTLTLFGVQARSQESSRETIIQGVRDDVRRKIQEEKAAGPSANHAYGRHWHHAVPPHGH